MSDKRFYQIAWPRGIEPLDFGHAVQISGMVFQGNDRNLILLTPDAKPLTIIGNDTFSEVLTTEQWSALLQASDDPQFYNSIDKAWHRKARYIISGAIQQKVWARDGFTCQLCGRKMGDVQMTIDHWVPLELGGENDTTNYISACRECNKKKGAQHPKDYCLKHYLDFNKLDTIAHTKP